MKRKLFFFLEKLEIERSERIAIGILMMLFVITSSAYTFYDPKPVYDDEYYAELDKVFLERSRQIESEKQQILARYEPQQKEVPPVSAKNVTETTSAEIPAPKDTVQTDNNDDSSFININKASEEELQELPGIGPAYAARIVQWRKENGSFKSFEQLLEIRGIGKKRLENIKPLIEL